MMTGNDDDDRDCRFRAIIVVLKRTVIINTFIISENLFYKIYL